MKEITREFIEAWPLIVAAFVAGLAAGWRRAITYRREHEREWRRFQTTDRLDKVTR